MSVFRKLLLGVTATGTLLAASAGIGVQQAAAHNPWPGYPPHTTLTNPSCTNSDCYTWILQNGAIMFGPWAHLSGQMPLVLTICTLKMWNPKTVRYVWSWNVSPPYGSWGTPGWQMPFCVNPKSPGGTPWGFYGP